MNGIAYGGALEIVLNCDLVIASENAKFGAIEVAGGLVAIHGAIPRMARTAGHQVSCRNKVFFRRDERARNKFEQITSEAYLFGRIISAGEACARYKWWVIFKTFSQGERLTTS